MSHCSEDILVICHSFLCTRSWHCLSSPTHCPTLDRSRALSPNQRRGYRLAASTRGAPLPSFHDPLQRDVKWRLSCTAGL